MSTNKPKVEVLPIEQGATPRKLKRQHRRFVDAYLQCWNGAEAARRAGYSEHSARITAARLLTDANISGEIEARLAEVHMSADEALKLLADQARGDIVDVMDVTPMGYVVDMAKAKERGVTRLIHRVKQKTVTISGKDGEQEIHTTEIELYDAQSALDKILRVHGKFAAEKLDITSGGEPLMTPEQIAVRVASLIAKAEQRKHDSDKS